MPELSIVVPAYNEEELIEGTLKKLKNELKKIKTTWEVIVVDDGSRDKTSNIVKKITNVKLIKLKVNKGKGAALREGMLAAKGKYVIFMDADLSVPLTYVNALRKELKNSDVVIGTRRDKNSKIVVHQPFLRESLGRVFTKLTQLFTNTQLTDYTCGFKGFKKEVSKKVFENSLIDRWAYDAEILFLANKYGYEIKEMPVEWYNRKASKVNLKNAIFTSFRDLISLRIYNLLGKYEN